MRNLYIINSNSKASQYGIGTYLRELLLSLSNISDLNISIIVLDDTCTEFSIEYDKSEEITYYHIPALGNNNIDKLKYFRSIFYIMAPYIETNAANVFHFNYLHHMPLAKMIKETWSNSVLCLTIHCFDWEFSLRGDVDKYSEILSKKEMNIDPLHKYIYNEYLHDKFHFSVFDKIITLSNRSFALLIRLYGIEKDKIELIQNGLKDEYDSINKDQLLSLKQSFGISTSDILILFVGRLDHNKGIPFLIKAMHYIVIQKKNVHLIVVGDGNYNLCIEASVNIWPKISYCGRISKEYLYKLYQISDIGILPSLHEQCSYVAIEMMMHGLPLLVTSNTGLSEMVNIHDENLLIDKESYSFGADYFVSEIYKKVISFIDLWEANKDNLGNRNREIYLKHFTLDVMIQNMELFYNKLFST